MPTPADLVTDRLVLRVMDAAAARAILAGRAPDGLQLAPGHPSPHSLDLARLAAAGPSDTDAGPYFVVRAADHAVIGEIGCRVSPGPRGPVGHVAYTIVETCWNQGYATEALRAVLTHLLHERGLPRVVGETLVGHGASRRVLAKAGMRPAGRGELPGARPDQLITYEALAGIWPGRRLSRNLASLPRSAGFSTRYQEPAASVVASAAETVR